MSSRRILIVAVFSALLAAAGCASLPQSGVGDTTIAVTVNNFGDGTVELHGTTIDNSGNQSAAQEAQQLQEGQLDADLRLTPIRTPGSPRPSALAPRPFIRSSPRRARARRRKRCSFRGSVRCAAARLGRLGGRATARKRRRGRGRKRR